MKNVLRIALWLALIPCLNAAIYNSTPAGLIKGARLEQVSTTQIKIGVGYGEILGSYWEILPSNSLAITGYTLTGLTTTTNGVMQYLYIDRTNSSLPDIAIRNSTTAPTWNEDFLGWYSGDDRCIGALFILPNGAISTFMCPDDDTYVGLTTQVLSGGSVSTTYGVWNALNLSSFLPVNASAAYLNSSVNHLSGTIWTYCKVGLKSDFLTFYEDGAVAATVTCEMPFSRGASKTISWMGFAQYSSNSAQVFVRGYRIER